MNKHYVLALTSLAAIAIFYLLREHAKHVLGVLSYLILLACPLLHLFGHRHHDHHGGQRDKPDNKVDEKR